MNIHLILIILALLMAIASLIKYPSQLLAAAVILISVDLLIGR